MASADERARTVDKALRARARAVIPGGMYGHQSAGPLPPEYPQFMRGGRGATVWDVDGNSYVDLMCSYGPILRYLRRCWLPMVFGAGLAARPGSARRSGRRPKKMPSIATRSMIAITPPMYGPGPPSQAR